MHKFCSATYVHYMAMICTSTTNFYSKVCQIQGNWIMCLHFMAAVLSVQKDKNKKVQTKPSFLKACIFLRDVEMP